MKDYGMGDEASIREIISEVDTDNVSFKFYNFNLPLTQRPKISFFLWVYRLSQLTILCLA